MVTPFFILSASLTPPIFFSFIIPTKDIIARKYINLRCLGMKGVHPFISATILILVTVVIATIVSSWTVNVTSDRAKTIINATQTKLNCQYAGFLVRNVTYDCSGACFTGSPYRINATIDNTGSSRILVEDMLVTLDNGISYHLSGNLSSISTGDIVAKLFDTITINTSSKIPTETMDVREAYVNGTNTIGLWHFDEGSGNTTTDAGRGIAGTLKNGTTTCNNSTNQCPLWNSTGKFGYGITFDGVNDAINITTTSDFNISAGGSLTMEAWFNLRSTDGTNWIMAKGNATNGYGISYENGPMCYVNSTTANATGNVTIATGTWYHFGCTFSGSQITIYIDGVRRANASYSNGIPNNSQPFMIGSRAVMDGFFNGTLDEMRLSNVSRASAVGLQYNITLPDISAVRVYNYTNALVDSASLSGSRYNKTLSGLPISEYRVEAEDSSGHRVEKWYPYKPGGSCVATSQLDKIQFSTANCPEITDTYPGTDVTFVGCA